MTTIIFNATIVLFLQLVSPQAPVGQDEGNNPGPTEQEGGESFLGKVFGTDIVL